jgi:hypothetical protein
MSADQEAEQLVARLANPLDAELAALEPLQRFKERLEAALLAEVRRLVDETTGIGGIYFEDVAGEVARVLREVAEVLEEG